MPEHNKKNTRLNKSARLSNTSRGLKQNFKKLEPNEIAGLIRTISYLKSEIADYTSKFHDNQEKFASTDIYVVERKRTLGKIFSRYPGLKKHIEGIEKGRSLVQNKEVNAQSINLIKDIENWFLNTKNDVLIVNDVTPLINNIDFVDYVVENKIEFTSNSNPEIAEAFCNTLLHISHKLDKSVGGNRDAGKRIKKEAIEFAKKMGPKLDNLEEQGFNTLASKATKLNQQKILTLRGKSWTRNTVKMVWERWKEIKPKEENNNSVFKP